MRAKFSLGHNISGKNISLLKLIKCKIFKNSLLINVIVLNFMGEGFEKSPEWNDLSKMAG